MITHVEEDAKCILKSITNFFLNYNREDIYTVIKLLYELDSDKKMVGYISDNPTNKEIENYTFTEIVGKHTPLDCIENRFLLIHINSFILYTKLVQHSKVKGDSVPGCIESSTYSDWLMIVPQEIELLGKLAANNQKLYLDIFLNIFERVFNSCKDGRIIKKDTFGSIANNVNVFRYIIKGGYVMD